MLHFMGRSLLSVLIVLQAVLPALACPCQSVEVVTDEPACGCEVETAAETECGCETTEIVVDSCDLCGEEVISSDDCDTHVDSGNEPTNPQPAETKKAESEKAVVTPQPALPPSSPAETSEDMGPAPINVPTDSAKAPSVPPAETNELFPGPAASDPVTPDSATPAPSTPPATKDPTTNDPAAPSSVNTEGLFDEPVAEPADSTPTEDTETGASVTTEELFVEPSQSSDTPETSDTEASDTEATDTETDETTEEAPPASNPLDELFGPSTPPTEQAPESTPVDETESTEDDGTETPAADPFDPFSQNELPAELRARGGLASQAFRAWYDRTHNFQVNARLIRMSAEGVFLADEAGKYVAMSFAQLSDADLTFVREQVRAQRVVLAKQRAALIARAAK